MRPFKISRRTAVGSLIGGLSFRGAISGAEIEQTSEAGNVAANNTLVYVGTYTGNGSKSKGIYFFRLQTTGNEVSQNITLVPLGLAVESTNPSFLELDLKRRLLFAVNEIDTFEGKVDALKPAAFDGHRTVPPGIGQ
jgi:6-phosphogluconolactonase